MNSQFDNKYSVLGDKGFIINELDKEDRFYARHIRLLNNPIIIALRHDLDTLLDE